MKSATRTVLMLVIIALPDFVQAQPLSELDGLDKVPTVEHWAYNEYVPIRGDFVFQIFAGKCVGQPSSSGAVASDLTCYEPRTKYSGYLKSYRWDESRNAYVKLASYDTWEITDTSALCYNLPPPNQRKSEIYIEDYDCIRILKNKKKPASDDLKTAYLMMSRGKGYNDAVLISLVNIGIVDNAIRWSIVPTGHILPVSDKQAVLEWAQRNPEQAAKNLKRGLEVTKKILDTACDLSGCDEDSQGIQSYNGGSDFSGGSSSSRAADVEPPRNPPIPAISKFYEETPGHGK